jgi:hypothetical protein
VEIERLSLGEQNPQTVLDARALSALLAPTSR